MGARFSQFINVYIYTSNVFCTCITFYNKKSQNAKRRIPKAEILLVRKYTASTSRSQSGMDKEGMLP